MISLFDDFGLDVALNKGQLKQSPEGFASLTAPLYGCPVYNNGACQGGIPGSEVGFQRDIRPVVGHQLCAPHVAGRRALGHHARSQCAVPALFRLQPAAVCMNGPTATTANWASTRAARRGSDYPRFVPSGRRGRLHLPAVTAGVRGAEPVPGTQKDVPADRVDDVLKTGKQGTEGTRDQAVKAISCFLVFFVPGSSCSLVDLVPWSLPLSFDAPHSPSYNPYSSCCVSVRVFFSAPAGVEIPLG